jgi:hypothetical protein
MQKAWLLIFIMTAWMQISAQIIINKDDMPAEGDTFRISLTVLPPVDFSRSGQDTTWDYTYLQPQAQRVDTFLSVTETPVPYWIVFIPNIVANLASPRVAATIPGLPVTDPYSFYMNSNTSFSDVGFAYTINGIPFPARYNNPDIWYEFPCSYGDTWSSESSLSLNIPGLIYYSADRQRMNFVDGWGTLKTPFGIFSVIRIKSLISQRDSLYIDSLGTGFPMQRTITEYKWLGKNSGIPILQISEEGFSVTAIYRDSTRMSAQTLTVNVGPDTSVYKGTILTSHALVTGGTPPYDILWNTMDTGEYMSLPINVDQTVSAVVIDALQNFASDSRFVTVKYPPGINEMNLKQLYVNPNPTNGKVKIAGPDFMTICGVEIYDMKGVPVREIGFNPMNEQEMEIDLTDLPSGIYIIRISDQNNVFLGEIVLHH